MEKQDKPTEMESLMRKLDEAAEAKDDLSLAALATEIVRRARVAAGLASAKKPD